MFEYDEFAPLAKIMETDKRYTIGAYIFVNEVISLATQLDGVGEMKPTEDIPGVDVPSETENEDYDEDAQDRLVEELFDKLQNDSDEAEEDPENDFVQEIEKIFKQEFQVRNSDEDNETEENDGFANAFNAFQDQDENTEELDLHITGQDLCHIAVQYASQLYGFMARLTLERFGIYTTGDIGNVVYNMISVGLMAKSPDDSREDFDDVFDLGSALDDAFKFHYKKRRRP